MFKYKYSYNTTTDTISRTVVGMYPSTDPLSSDMQLSIPAKTVLNHHLEYLIGVTVKQFLVNEDNWFVSRKAVEAIKAKLNSNNEVELSDEDKASLANELVYLENELAQTIKTSPWVVGYTKVDSYKESTSVSLIPKVEVSPSQGVLKKLVAHERNLNVRNLEDTVADLAKMNSLLFSMVSRIYEVLDATTKDNIPAADKAVMEYAIDKFKTSTTRADKQLTTEGLNLVDKLFEREVAISNIVDEYLGDN